MAKFFRWCGKILLNATIAALALILLVSTWYYLPSLIVDLLDLNQDLIRSGSALLPKEYKGHVESFLRLMQVEAVLLYIEAQLTVWCVLFALRRLVRRFDKKASPPPASHH